MIQNVYLLPIVEVFLIEGLLVLFGVLDMLAKLVGSVIVVSLEAEDVMIVSIVIVLAEGSPLSYLGL